MKRQVDSIIPPDRPDSPVPAWKHYYICNYAEDRIIRQLEEHHEDKLLVGLSVGYLFIPKDEPESAADNKFSMFHGYLVDCDDEDVGDERPEGAPNADQSPPSPEEKEQKGGLGDDFISEIYDEVKQLILQNAPDGIGEYLVSLEVTTAHFSKPKLTCEGQRCGVCATHNKRHMLRKKKKNENECTWTCTGSDC